MDCFDTCRQKGSCICRTTLASGTQYFAFFFRQDIPVYTLSHLDSSIHLEGVSAHRITTLVHVRRAVRQMTRLVIQHGTVAVGSAGRGGVNQHAKADQ